MKIFLFRPRKKILIKIIRFVFFFYNPRDNNDGFNIKKQWSVKYRWSLIMLCTSVRFTCALWWWHIFHTQPNGRKKIYFEKVWLKNFQSIMRCMKSAPINEYLIIISVIFVFVQLLLLLLSNVYHSHEIMWSVSFAFSENVELLYWYDLDDFS